MNKVLKTVFSHLNIPKTDLVTHEKVLTSEQHKNVLQKIGLQFSYILCKNIFLTNKKTKENLLFVIPSHSKKTNLKKFGEKIGMNGQNLRFANSALVQKVLKSSQGNISPLSLINDEENLVTVYLDKSLSTSKNKIGVHPLTNDATIFLEFDEIVRILEYTKHSPIVVDMEMEETKVAMKNGKSKNSTMPPSRDEKGLSCTQEEDFAKWYSEVLTKGHMIEYYDISGCYVLCPNSCFVWNRIRDFFNIQIEKIGVQEAYFPLFVSKSALEAEANHIEGFKPEVAWVTHSGESKLNAPVAIRPTSETIMYPIYRKWIRSHRDLPLKINQWANIVRWEFKHPTPFIRTREFLWQEGHSAFASKAEADADVLEILDIYAKVYEELLAVPVIKGRKTDCEKFPGGDYTTTVETFIAPNGRSIQGATSHGLGQNFGQIFSISFEDEHKRKQIPYQNSWGLTTRTIGVMIMVHGDDRGMILPPKVARHQIVIVPITDKKIDGNLQKQKYTDLSEGLKSKGIRVYIDDRENYKPGWKYNEWELHGIPLRIEFGPKDLQSNQCVFVRRDTGEKIFCPLLKAPEKAVKILSAIQKNLYDSAKDKLISNRVPATSWDQFMAAVENKKMALVPFCLSQECEMNVKDKTKGAEGEEAISVAVKSLCIPFEQESFEKGEEQKCFACEKQAQKWTLFGRSY